jgi:hypothetical protein
MISARFVRLMNILITGICRFTGSTLAPFFVAGGVDSAMSLAQLSDWCAERFGRHDVEPESVSRSYDVPFFAGEGYVSLLFLHSWILFGTITFLSVTACVRYLQPMSLLTILIFAALVKAVTDRRSRRTSAPIS